MIDSYDFSTVTLAAVYSFGILVDIILDYFKSNIDIYSLVIRSHSHLSHLLTQDPRNSTTYFTNIEKKCEKRTRCRFFPINIYIPRTLEDRISQIIIYSLHHGGWSSSISKYHLGVKMGGCGRAEYSGSVRGRYVCHPGIAGGWTARTVT